jgi:hypothetical protein
LELSLLRLLAGGLMIVGGISMVISVYHAFRFFSNRSATGNQVWVGFLGPLAMFLDQLWTPKGLHHRVRFIVYFLISLVLWGLLFGLRQVFPEVFQPAQG